MSLFVIIWILVVFILIAKNIARFIENENSPVLTVPAVIVDMERKTHHHHHSNGHHISHSYHITFETQDGERMELRVKRHEYNQLAVGDKGTLTHQGTRYLGFERL